MEISAFHGINARKYSAWKRKNFPSVLVDTSEFLYTAKLLSCLSICSSMNRKIVKWLKCSFRKKTWFIFFVQKQTNCHLTSSIHCSSQWGSRHLLYHFHALCTYWEPFNFSPGKLVPRGFWERETNAVQWKPWSSTANRGNCYNLKRTKWKR